MVAEGGTKELTYDQILDEVLPDGRGARRRLPQGGDRLLGRGPPRQPGHVRFRCDRDAHLAPFAPEDFERLRNEALDYVTKTLRGNNDEELGKWTLQAELYKGHPYGHPDRGTVQGLKAITLDDVKAFHQAHYTPRGAHASGVGRRLAPTSVRRAASSEPRSCPRSGELVPPELPAPEHPQGLDVTIVEKPAEATAISIGFPIDVTRRDDDFYALAVANSYLGEHRTFNGKLMQDLRGKRG